MYNNVIFLVKGVYALKKAFPLLLTIPAYSMLLFPLIINSTLSDFTKGSVYGIMIGLALGTIFIACLNIRGVTLEQSKFKKLKARLLRSK